MSREIYQLDSARHGGVHVDRYSPQSTHKGRYQLDGTPMANNGKLPSPHTKF